MVITYSPLGEDEIRLFDFSAGFKVDLLMHVNVKRAPTYFALSYPWGNDHTLKGFTFGQHQVLLSYNLRTVFEELISRHFRGKLWIDAICVDQTNEQEKTIQIPLMGTIFRNAKWTITWLGLPVNGSTVTDANLRALSGAMEDMGGDYENISFEAAIDRFALPPENDRFWTDIYHLWCNEWFVRVWTLQEAILARRIAFYYGSCSLSLNALSRIAFFLLNQVTREPAMYTASHKGFVNTGSIQRYRKNLGLQHETESGLISLIRTIRVRQCTYEQDRVWGIYSLLPTQVQVDLRVDTTLDPADVFKKFAQSIFKNFPGVGMHMLHISGSACRLLAVPSWVLDLSTKALASVYSMSFDGEDFCAGQIEHSRQPSFILSRADQAHTLGMHGHVLGTVSRKEDYPPDIHVETEDRPHGLNSGAMAGWISRCLVTAMSHLPDNYEFPLCRTLVASKPTYSSSKRSHSVRESDVRFIRWLQVNLSEWSTNPELLADEIDSEPDTRGYLQSMVKRSRDHTFFVTSGNRVGLGPKNLEPRDMIVVLNGMAAPFAVRPSHVLSGTCELLGDCYVDGIMHGEAMRAHRESGAQDQLFTFS